MKNIHKTKLDSSQARAKIFYMPPFNKSGLTRLFMRGADPKPLNEVRPTLYEELWLTSVT